MPQRRCRVGSLIWPMCVRCWSAPSLIPTSSMPMPAILPVAPRWCTANTRSWHRSVNRVMPAIDTPSFTAFAPIRDWWDAAQPASGSAPTNSARRRERIWKPVPGQHSRCSWKAHRIKLNATAKQFYCLCSQLGGAWSNPIRCVYTWSSSFGNCRFCHVAPLRSRPWATPRTSSCWDWTSLASSCPERHLAHLLGRYSPRKWAVVGSLRRCQIHA